MFPLQTPFQRPLSPFHCLRRCGSVLTLNIRTRFRSCISLPFHYLCIPLPNINLYHSPSPTSPPPSGDFVPCSPTGQPFVLPPPPLPSTPMAMYGGSPFTASSIASQPSSPGSGRRLSRNVAVSLALQLAESSKDQYYSVLQAFQESEPSHSKSLLHTVDNQLLPSLTAASSSLRSLAATSSSFDGVLLETKSRELGGIMDSFASLRKLIIEKTSEADASSPLPSSTATSIAAFATQRVAAAGDAIAASSPQQASTSSPVTRSESFSSHVPAVSSSASSNPFFALTSSSSNARITSSVTQRSSISSSVPSAPLSPLVDGASSNVTQALHQPQPSLSADLHPRVSRLF